MVDYFEDLVQSCKDILKHHILISPFILQTLAFIFAGALLFGLSALLLIPLLGLDFVGLMNGDASFLWSGGSIFIIVCFLLLIAILLALLNAWFTGGILGMINAVIEKKSPSAKIFFETARERYKAIFGYTIERSLISLLLATPGILFILLALLGVGSRYVTIPLAVLFGLISFFLIIFFGIILFFVDPIIIRRKLTGWDSIIASFHLLKKRPNHLFASWGIALLFTIVINMIAAMLTLPFQIGANISAAISPWMLLLVAILVLLRVLVQLIASIITLIYTFRMHKVLEMKKGAKRTMVS